MTSTRPELATESTQAYCRRARQLRHRLRHAPVRMHRQLRALRPADSAVAAAPPTANDRFADAVARALDAGTLRYSRRLKLLKEADRLGLERFEANLVIAMVQHRLRNNAELPQESASPIPPWLVVVAVQAAIVLVAVACWMNWMR